MVMARNVVFIIALPCADVAAYFFFVIPVRRTASAA
jgi:hypothetical protein